MIFKNQYSALLYLIVMFFSLSGCQGTFPEKVSPISNFSELEELFADPPADYRSAPLWDWNTRITREGIDFHLSQFKEAGIGGVFVHPRPGLITEYLSDEWFELFDYTVQKGKELGMNVWIYDENSYPSGFAGGHVPAEMPESWNQGSGLMMKVQEVFQPSDENYEVILKQLEDGFADITDHHSDEIGNEGTFYLFKKTYPPTSYWYGGFTYVDLLQKGVTEKFIEVTMTRGYEKLSASDFGHTVKGVFTDEPNLEAAMDRGATVFRWTPDLWEAFEERWGYDLRIHLPSLVEETGQWQKVRHDYYELILELFIDRWAKPWYAYCEEKGLAWTGHYWEHGWPFPTHGFDEAAFYMWHQQPGIDMLGGELVPEGMGGQFGNTRAVRELASGANQGGHLRTLSETYGGGGWQMDFATYKQLADWQGVLGVNFVNQHLSYFTLRGVRKFDYPPSFTYHEPWWDNYRLLGDYIGRMSLAGSSGEQINDILVLQPNTTAWMYFSRRVKNPRMEGIQQSFKSFVWQLERNHVEYDLGSEHVLQNFGSVHGDKLRAGNREYGVVVIPASMENLDQSTYDLLTDFLAGGGEVFSFNTEIPYLDGEASGAVNELLNQYPEQCKHVQEISDPDFQKAVALEEFAIKESSPGRGELYHQRRLLEDGQLIMLVNSSADQSVSATIEAHGKSVIQLDPLTGEITQLKAESEGKKVTFKADLLPIGSSVYFISTRTSSLPFSKTTQGKGKTLVAENEIEVTTDQDNILVLNYLDLKAGDLKLKDNYFMDALLALFDSHGLEMGNPWQHKIQYRQEYVKRDTFPENSGFEASYHFNLSHEMDTDAFAKIKAVVEGHELWDVYINGNLVQKEEESYWIDKDFHYFPVGDYLKPGKNTLTLKASKMSLYAELMPVYITGPFLVHPLKSGFEITDGALNSMGSWKDQGLPFYSHKVSYSRTFQIEEADADYAIRLKQWKGTTAEVYVNGQKAGQICWAPYELQVGHLLKEGENQITVKVVGSLKNTFGHFFKTWESVLNGPGDWNVSPAGEIPSIDQYSLMDYGLYEPFELLIY
ncbi:MAG: hypothetical protein GY790_20505 [Bacteroidetes bacterium]|nr:hypothetical protein [Bacteroidota bacterium]